MEKCSIWPSFYLLFSLAAAAQPSAPAPVAAPMRPLIWGDINFLQTTDTHGWHAGHLQEAQYAADWGDYISFAERLREKADQDGVDLLLVDTGDRIEGNGLYDASEPKGQYTYDIFREQDIDIICTGNHELYQADAAAREYTQTVPNFKGKYLASNLDYIDPKTGDRVPMAQRYRKFTTKNRGIRVLAMGFLFDFTGNANNTVVEPVKETIKEEWFQDAIREEVDLFVIIGHVTLHGPEYKALFQAIRAQNWDVPIQFFGGHSHIRDFAKYDSKAYGLQSGRYMETIGWASIQGIKGKEKDKRNQMSSVSPSFNRRYIDNNLFGYYHHTALNESSFPTDHGKKVSGIIREARKSLELDHNFGCAPKDLWLNRAPFPSNDSLFSWLGDEVLPAVVQHPDREDTPTLALTNTGAMRFDIFQGAFTRDTTYIISPFISKFVYIKDVPYGSASQILRLINNGGPVFESSGLKMSQLTSPEHISIQRDIVPVPTTEVSGSQIPLGSSVKPDLVPGYTTHDEAGDDGDDTVHSPITFYRVPNCIESRIAFPAAEAPKTVDLVFIDFIQPWVLMALTFTGEKYTSGDVQPYLDEPFTDLLARWIKRNWGQDC
ncbi:calcineurin-like phosphoesterase [Phlyctema vagabunda]|uniref:Calcineurin-like phosphoesterase n=1 Tax=Phlyctema vagabunda TaxID=108571 RepID=A0ABR4P6G5_9HELO